MNNRSRFPVPEERAKTVRGLSLVAAALTLCASANAADGFASINGDTPGGADREYLNVVAQEFQEVFPEEVRRSGEKLADGDDILQVDTYPLTIYSAAAVQELNRKVELQQRELKQKETEIATLQQRLDALEKIILKQNLN